MAMRNLLSFCILYLVALANLFALTSCAAPAKRFYAPFNRTSFPSGFVFGASAAAYQIEGEALKGGRGPSIWDTFTRQHPEKIFDGSTADVAVDFYHRYKDDIRLLKDVGLRAFRMSISWSRILPYGKVSKGVNPEGIKFYNDVFNELIANGITPFVTLFHWDTPQALEDEYRGFLSSEIAKDYGDYVDICFKEFGDRVKNWITLNEPLSYSMNGYTKGTFAPGRCSKYVGNCTEGNSGTEPYIVAHNLLLAHATGVKVYRDKYQKTQKGQIGVTLVSHWFVPKINTPQGLQAPLRALDFMLGWFLDPITYGDYPASMRAIVGRRLPKFTAEQSKLVKGSMDFLGINYYTTYYASPLLSINRVNLSYTTDNHADLSPLKGGKPIGTPTALDWLFIYPRGIYGLMLHIKEKYNNPPIYITENGMAEANNSTMSLKESLNDDMRIKYYEGHLWFLSKAIKCAISWKATLQHVVALSTTEAEYMAVTEAIKEALWLKGLFAELSLHQGSIIIFCDSQSAIHLTKDQMYHERMKHIDIKYHFIRETIAEGKVSVQNINTRDNPANMFTKSLPANKFKLCLNLIGIYDE